MPPGDRMVKRVHSRNLRAAVKGAVIFVFLVLPVLLLAVSTDEPGGSTALFGPAVVAVGITYAMAVRLDRTIWAVGAGIGVVASFFWADFLLAPPDEELALAGPLGGYLICLLIALAGTASDFYRISKAKRAQRRASAA
jgi:hypothetical protein